jgi:hypothetical protein
MSQKNFWNQNLVKPRPGTMIIFPEVFNTYSTRLGIDKFKFIHWNIQCVRKNV